MADPGPPAQPSKAGVDQDARPVRAVCPFCGSRDGEVISLFGTHAMLMQHRCRECGSYYESNKYVPDGSEP